MKEILKKSILTATHLTLFACAATATFFLLGTRKEKLQLEEQLKVANGKIVAITKELGEAKIEAEFATKELAEISNKTSKLSDNLEAFAKQAAACEKVKKQFKVGNT